MASITIITIVVVALLTVIIFGLAWLGWSSCLKSYRMEAYQGKHDKEILKEYHSKKNKSGLIGIICSYLALSILAGLFITGIVYKARGENLEFNNQTVLVIKSGSMSDYYDEDLANEYQAFGYKEYHFDVGDICVFERINENTKLVKGEVYGYKYKDIIITHRLIGSNTKYNICKLPIGTDLSELNYFEDKDCMIPATGKVDRLDVEYYELVERLGYKFRGDNNYSIDPYTVKSESIIYRYNGQKVPGIGAFILYAQSYFGLWSLLGIIGIAISSEIVYHKLDKINKDRYKIIIIPKDTDKSEQKEEVPEQDTREIKVQFRRKDGALVTIYKKKNQQKGPTAEAPSKTHEEKEGADNEK